MNAANAPLTVHPAAEAYRLMTEEELASLAADIAENGQNDPIVLGRIKGSTEQHQIIDGRNRAKACGIAGLVPKLETREFEDEETIRAFVKSRSERRDISKGQRAMGHALLYPAEFGKGGRGKKTEAANRADTAQFSIRRLKEARSVLHYSQELARSVRDGVVSLDDALTKIVAERTKLDTTEAKLTRLRSGAQDLAELVNEDRMSLDDALAALSERERKTHEVISAGRRAAQSGMTDFLANVASIAAATQLGERDLMTSERLDAVVDAANNLKQLLGRSG